jgi:hypothetical protein
MRTSAFAVAFLLLLLPHGEVRADDAAVAEARQLFVAGTDRVKHARWAEALDAFERSAKLRPHPVTSYNIGACERALGRYTRARAAFLGALETRSGGRGDADALPDVLRTEARGLVDEIDRLVARVAVTIEPAEATITVDGRPLAVLVTSPSSPSSPSSEPTLVAGTAEPGPGTSAPTSKFALVLDPGAHVFVLSRKGFSDVVVNRTFAPGARAVLALVLDRLPASLHVESEPGGAVVTIDGRDVGPVPAEVARPAGRYRVTVHKPGFDDYEALVSVEAGGAASLSLTKRSVFKRWWFWTSVAAAVAGATLGSYFIARSAQEPRLDGGGLQWIVNLR